MRREVKKKKKTGWHTTVKSKEYLQTVAKYVRQRRGRSELKKKIRKAVNLGSLQQVQ